jgi:hypothetical protein
MAFDVLKWLKEDLGVDEAVTTELAPKLTPFAAKIESGYLRQADYSRQMNELNAKIKTDADALQAAQTQLDAQIAEWATVEAAGKTATAKMRADMEAAQNDVLRLQQVLRKTADQTGLKYDDLVAGVQVDTKPPKDDKTVAPDMSKYIDRDQYNALSRMALLVPAQLDRIQREHHELTGEWLNPEEIVAEVQARAATKGNTKSLELRDIWEEKYQIPEKRTAKAKKEHDEEIAAAEKRGAERAMSEATLPGGGTPSQGHHSPIFRQEHKPVLQRPAAGQPNAAAVSALRSGKYRQAPVGAPAAK